MLFIFTNYFPHQLQEASTHMPDSSVNLQLIRKKCDLFLSDRSLTSDIMMRRFHRQFMNSGNVQQTHSKYIYISLSADATCVEEDIIHKVAVINEGLSRSRIVIFFTFVSHLDSSTFFVVSTISRNFTVKSSLEKS